MSKNATKSGKNNKNAKSGKSAKKSAAPSTAKSPKASKGKSLGRPRYVPSFPKSEKWTLRDFMKVNGVDPETGKGERCSKLTLIKFIARELKRKGHSAIKRLDETTAPESEKGMGRKAFVYSLRPAAVKDSAPETADAPAAPADVTPSPASGDITVPVTDIATPAPAPEAPGADATPAPSDVSPETADYEATKAALLGAGAVAS